MIVTTSPPLLAGMVAHWAPPNYLAQLNRIDYLANVCMVLRLDRSLPSTYWLNVNDTSFPYVGVIDHTNFEHPDSYGGDHVIYVSRNLPHTDVLYRMAPNEILEFSLPHLQRMFPAFSRDWIRAHDVWKARWAQPVVERRYSTLIPPETGRTPVFACVPRPKSIAGRALARKLAAANGSARMNGPE